MKNPLSLALTLVLLSSAPMMAADMSPGINAELNQSQTQHDLHSTTEIQKGQTESEQTNQTEFKTNPENKSEGEAIDASKESMKTVPPETSAMKGSPSTTETQVNQEASSKNVQKLFNKFQKENAPQTEANAKTDLNVETTTTEKNMK